MLETEYSDLFGQYHVYWGMVLTEKDRQHVGLLHCEFSLLLLNKIQDMIQNENTSFIVFKTIQHVKS